jgi:phosphatidylinositol glycan class M
MNKLILAAIALRAGLLLFGTWQDSHLAVKYTDIDYEVYTDAAQFMVQGGSPYQRSTYRYSPLLAALLTPNILVHRSFGKLLFALADILAALLMQRLLQRRYKNNKKSKAPASSPFSFQTTTTLALALWLFSPFTVSISTRGNGEALVTCMLLGMLDLLENNYIITSGMLYGLAVHWRVYPIIYSLPILKHLAINSTYSYSGSSSSIIERRRTRSSTGAVRTTTPTTTTSESGKKKNKIKISFINSLFSLTGFKFGLSAAFIFLSLGIGLYHLYGYEFLHETYLYHATRIDPRHNFSPYYLPAYLGTEEIALQVDSSTIGNSTINTSFLFSMLNKALFRPIGINVDKIFNTIVVTLGDGGKIWSLATLLLQVILGWAFAEKLESAFFLQTVAFVAFNKVATAQYFVWYFSWLPLVLPTLLQAPNKVRYLYFF